MDFKIIKEEMKKNVELHKTNGYAELGEVYWTYNIIFMPVQVKVLETEDLLKKARIEQGWIDYSRLYKNKEDCPQR